MVVDLRGEDEDGVSEEEKLAKKLGIKYVNIPVTQRAPETSQVEQLATLIHDSANFPS